MLAFGPLIEVVGAEVCVFRSVLEHVVNSREMDAATAPIAFLPPLRERSRRYWAER